MKNLNPTTTIFFAVTSVLAVIGFPLHLYFYDLSLWHLVLFVTTFSLSLLSITCGYHRLYAHRSYEAAWPVRLFFLILGAGTFQQSCLKWASEHRVHHHHVDTPKDPYSRKRGFWWSHMGWIFSSESVNAPHHKDLLNDPLIVWQKKYWVIIGSMVSFVIPFLIGLYFGDPLGGLLYGGLLRLFVAHQATFSINSVAHTLGSQPYSIENTAKDHWITSILTFGEGYHNFHHWYARDYRNGIRLFQWDPGKWLIRTMNWFGLAWNLRKASEEAILNAKAKVKLSQAQAFFQPSMLDQLNDSYEDLKVELTEKYDELCAQMERYAEAKKQWLMTKKLASEYALEQQRQQMKLQFKEARRQMHQSYRELCRLAQSIQQTGLSVAS